MSILMVPSDATVVNSVAFAKGVHDAACHTNPMWGSPWHLRTVAHYEHLCLRLPRMADQKGHREAGRLWAYARRDFEYDNDPFIAFVYPPRDAVLS